MKKQIFGLCAALCLLWTLLCPAVAKAEQAPFDAAKIPVGKLLASLNISQLAAVILFLLGVGFAAGKFYSAVVEKAESVDLRQQVADRDSLIASLRNQITSSQSQQRHPSIQTYSFSWQGSTEACKVKATKAISEAGGENVYMDDVAWLVSTILTAERPLS